MVIYMFLNLIFINWFKKKAYNTLFKIIVKADNFLYIFLALVSDLLFIDILIDIKDLEVVKIN